MGQSLNGNFAMAPDKPEPPKLPAQLVDLKEAFTKWSPLVIQLTVGARFHDALTKPKVELSLVWPQYVAWLLSDEIYGMLQYFDGHKRLTDIGMELIRLLEMRGRGEHVPEYRMLEMAEELLPYGEGLNDGNHIAAGSAWQAMFAAAMGDAALAVRYAVLANQMGQPGDRNVAMMAAINVHRKKVMELLKA